jgi:hypothetical protein
MQPTNIDLKKEKKKEMQRVIERKKLKRLCAKNKLIKKA